MGSSGKKGVGLSALLMQTRRIIAMIFPFVRPAMIEVISYIGLPLVAAGLPFVAAHPPRPQPVASRASLARPTG
jgi:hypothetical protein